MKDIKDLVAAWGAEFVDELKSWLAIASVSADPARHADVARSAEWLAACLRRTGFPVVEVWPTGTIAEPGLPTVFAEWPAAAADAPAVLVYGHHDVQPGEPREEWLTDPFVPVIRGDELLGAGRQNHG